MQIETTLSPRPHFDPRSSEREFSIATTDYVEALLLPPLLTRLQQEAPGIRLRIRHLPAHLPLDEIESGAFDLAIGLAEDVPKRFRRQQLLEDDYLCAMSANHELAGKALTRSQYVRSLHLLVAPETRRKKLARTLYPGGQRQPEIIANLPHFLAAIHAVRESDLLLTAPRRLLQKFEEPFGLHLAELPFTLPPFQVSAVWHQIRSADQGLAWLRKLLAEVALG